MKRGVSERLDAAIIWVNAGFYVLSALLMGIGWYRIAITEEGMLGAASFAGAGSGLMVATVCLLASGMLYSFLVIHPRLKTVRTRGFHLDQLAEKLKRQTITDPLTGMHNRRYFEEALKGYLGEFNREGASLGLLIFDLDHFKSVNDNFGHDVGDMVLKEVALRMRAICREYDVVARLGGEEFALITPHAGRKDLIGIAERYRKMVEALRIRHENVIIQPTISIGVATNEEGSETFDTLYRAADSKLYEAKQAGRNRYAA